MSAEPVSRLYPFVFGRTQVSPVHPVTVRSPYSGDIVGRTGEASGLEVERALDLAASAREPMRQLSSEQRRRALLELEQAVAAHQDELAILITAEAGKPVRDARAEVKRGLLTLRTAAEEAARIGGEVMPLDLVPGAEGRFGITRRVPVGVVVGITPFNFPLNLVLHKLAPAIACGNPILIKASPRTPLTALRLGELAAGVGLPDGAVSVLSGGAATVEHMLADARVAMLSFTGSAPVGWELKQRAPRMRVTLELGGNAPNFVHHDADLDHAAQRLVTGAYAYAGQSCISVQRVFAHRGIYDALRARLVAGTQALRVGDPRDAATDVGPMIDEASAIRAESWIREAVVGGAKRVTGGERDGAFLTPCILENVRPEMKVCSEEAFAPLLVLIPYSEIGAVLAEANASRYGLQAGLFTRDMRFIMQAFEQLEVGGIIVNDVSAYRVDPMPYGGIKDSGVGREGIRYTIESMTELKLLVLGR